MEKDKSRRHGKEQKSFEKSADATKTEMSERSRLKMTGIEDEDDLVENWSRKDGKSVQVYMKKAQNDTEQLRKKVLCGQLLGGHRKKCLCIET